MKRYCTITDVLSLPVGTKRDKIFDVVLVDRRIDCSKVGRDVFALAVVSDIEKSQDEFKRLAVPYIKKNATADRRTVLGKERACYESRLTTYASNKWKTESRREEFVTEKLREYDNMVNKDLARLERDCDNKRFEMFDFGRGCNNNTLTDMACFPSDVTVDDVRKLYDYLSANKKYFSGIVGWKVVYGTSYDLEIKTRPQFVLEFTESAQDEINKNKTKLCEYAMDNI